MKPDIEVFADLANLLLEAYKEHLFDAEEDECPIEIADRYTNDYSTALLADALAVSKNNPDSALAFFDYQRRLFAGMSQIMNDVMVAVVDVNEMEEAD